MPAKKAAKVKKKIVNTDELEKIVNKKYGARTLIRASDPSLQIQRIPSGILSIDKLLGGGFARGRHTEIFGGYSVCKTYLAFRILANAQAMGLEGAYLDVEASFDPVFAGLAGVDLEKLVFPPNIESGNRAVDLMEIMIRSELFDVIVLDSIAALLPKEELAEDMEQGGFGTYQAKMMSKAMRKLTSALNSVQKKPVLIYINQTRQAIGVVFGNSTAIPGGKAMGFYAGTRIELIRAGAMKSKRRHVNTDTGEVTKKEMIKGHRALVRVEKEKTGGTIRGAQSTFVFDYEAAAIDELEDILYCGLLTGLIEKKGQQWRLAGMDEKITGRKAFMKYLASDPEYLLELENEIREAPLLVGDTEDDDEEDVEESE